MRLRSFRWLGLLVVLALLLGVAATATAQPPTPGASVGDEEPTAPTPASRPQIDLATYQAKRWIVQLKDPPAAKYKGGIGNFKATAIQATGETKLNVDSANTKAYISYLEARQKAFTNDLLKVAPGAKVDLTYQVVLNGMAVQMSPEQASAVRQMSSVKAVTPDVPVYLHMFSSLPWIGAPDLWAKLGGQDRAGEGVKVAVIDGGIYVKYDANGQYAGNKCFDGAGYTMPAGYPKGDARFTNAKVIVARTYFRSFDPPAPGEDTPIPGTPAATPHGTHTAGTIACNAGTQATTAGVTETISGVAPRAYLMNYRVFYPSTNPDPFLNGNGFVGEVARAVEDAVRDGADVINGSLGSTYNNTLAWPDPQVQALEAAWDAGVVPVFSNGNDGPNPQTVGQPAVSNKVIAVGASTKPSSITSGFVDVVAPAPVPGNLTGKPYGQAQFGPAITARVGPIAYVPVGKVDTSGSTLACGDPSSTLPAGSLTGKMALIQRGACNFSLKVWNAQQAGAVGVIIYNNAAGGEGTITMAAGAHADEVTIPSASVGYSMGVDMTTFYNTNPGTATVQIDPSGRVTPNRPDEMAGFSSRGPAPDGWIKPDVVAPGVNVLSSGYGPSGQEFTGFGQVSGTSMAAPHVAGSVALLRQLHPTWRPWQIKSALMSTAKTEGVVNVDGSPAGVLDRGAGRIDLTRAGTPGLVFDQPSLSGGRVAAGASRRFVVNAQDVSGTASTWSLAATTSDPAFGVGVVTTSLSVPANGSATLSVTLSTTSDAASGDYEGELRLTNGATGEQLHIPVWLRVVPQVAAKDILLIDDDGSSVSEDLPNVSGVYTSTLDSLGLTYTYLDIGENAFPGLYDLYNYKAVLVFMGANDSFNTSGFSETDHDRLMEWLDGGGRWMAVGQNVAETTDSNSNASPSWGRSRLYHGYLGLTYITGDVYGNGPTPNPTAQGLGPMAGLQLDLSQGNQLSIEATKAMTDSDSVMAPETMTPLFHPLEASVSADTNIAWGRSSSPSLAEMRQKYLYRAVSMGFGLEGITDTATRLDVSRRATNWLLDTLSASVSAGAANQYAPTTLTAQATSSAGAAITQYRWDFGDGSPIQTTTTASVQHTFKAAGPKVVRVEVTDALGHTAVATTTVNVAAYVCDPRNPQALCNGVVQLRAFIDLRCDTFFNAGTDTPLTGTEITASLPDGSARKLIVDAQGNAALAAITLPPGATVTLAVSAPNAPPWVAQQGSSLTSCSSGPTSFTLGRSNFSAFGVAFRDFRWDIAR